MVVVVLSALAEPTRLEAMRKLGATQSRMSRHMQVLRQAGLMVDRRDAQWVRYRTNPELSPALARLVGAALDQGLTIGEAAA